MSYVCEHCGEHNDGEPACEQHHRGYQGELITVPLYADCCEPEPQVIG